MLLRVSAVLSGCAVLALGSWLLARDPLLVALGRLHDGAGPGTLPGLLPDLVAGVMAAVLLGAAAWLVATTVLATLATLVTLVGCLRPVAPGRGAVLAARIATGAERPCPPVVRRTVAAVLGVAVVAGAAPALAEPSGAGRLAGLRLPDRVTGTSWTLAAPATLTTHHAERDAGDVIVRPGDSLWSLAARLLPHRAGDPEVSRAWHALYDANRTAVGADPDLIRPGTRLVVPHRLNADRKEPQ